MRGEGLTETHLVGDRKKLTNSDTGARTVRFAPATVPIYTDQCKSGVPPRDARSTPARPETTVGVGGGAVDEVGFPALRARQQATKL